MKLRVRFNGRTKIIVIQDEPFPTIEDLKNKVKLEAFSELDLNQDTAFEISLDGKTSIGIPSTLLKDAGIVSGDLIKLIVTHGQLSGSQSNVGTSQPVTAAASAMSVIESDLPSTSIVAGTAMPGTSAEAENSAAAIFDATHTPASEFSSDESERIIAVPFTDAGPIFFRDCGGEATRAPLSLQNIYQSPLIKSDFHIMCAVIHFMMRECGFLIEGQNDEGDLLELLQPGLFKADYSHPAGEHLKLELVCTKLGGMVAVLALVVPCANTAEQPISLNITIKNHMKESIATGRENSNAAAMFIDLSKLNKQIKQDIAHPALNHMREELCLPPMHGLLSLFPEIINYILTFLDYKSLLAIGQVNKALREIANDDTLWRNLYIRDYKSHPVNMRPNSSWKEMYKVRYEHEKKRAIDLENLRNRRLIHDPYFMPDSPAFYPPPQQPFGMIGGEHDLHPSFPYGPFANPNRRLPPNRPPHPFHPDNPLPGSRFDPIYPGGGGAFRPGRGGGMRDPSLFDSESGGPGNMFGRRPGRSGRRFDYI